nr:MAG TPA: hypothetical protein [Caudoviricetes sp.]
MRKKSYNSALSQSGSALFISSSAAAPGCKPSAAAPCSAPSAVPPQWLPVSSFRPPRSVPPFNEKIMVLSAACSTFLPVFRLKSRKNAPCIILNYIVKY